MKNGVSSDVYEGEIQAKNVNKERGKKGEQRKRKKEREEKKGKMEEKENDERFCNTPSR